MLLQKLNQQIKRAKAILWPDYNNIKNIETTLMSFLSSLKGMLGETVINVATWLMLDKAIYHRLNNITLPLSNGGSTQIDHVIVSVYGIFVIETKHYKGWIFGSEKQAQWTQVIMGRKYKFQNPLRQNYLHIKTLYDLLDLDMNCFHSMIVFIGECELKTRDELPEHVLKSGMVSYIKKKQDKILTEIDVQAIVEQIETNRLTKSWQTNKQHKAYLKSKHTNPNTVPDIQDNVSSQEVAKSEHVSSAKRINNNSFDNNSVYITPFEILESKSSKPVIAEKLVETAIPNCPKCGIAMTKRIAKQGARQGQSFFGCTQFPKCRGVVNITK